MDATLHEVADGVWAYLQGDGSWGWSNAGLVAAPGREGSLLVDTLFDLALTETMLERFRAVTPAAAEGRIGTVVNTHANGDHCYGNALVTGAEIVASRASADEMDTFPAARLAALMTMARSGAMGAAGEYLARVFGPFRFDGIEPAPPTTTFSGTMTLDVGGRTVELVELGPAHTAGDVVAWLPAERVLFAGDLLFIGGHPIMWDGPVGNWLSACDRMLELDPAVVVPGHGPLTGLDGIRAVRDYWSWLDGEARPRFDAGMAPFDAACDIDASRYDGWGDGERIAINVRTLYREYGDTTAADLGAIWTEMAVLSGRA